MLHCESYFVNQHFPEKRRNRIRIVNENVDNYNMNH